MAISSKTRSVKKTSGVLALKRGFFSKNYSKLNAKDRKFFTEQLSLLLETGSSLQASLQAMQSQVSKLQMKSIIAQLQDDVENGRQLSTALSKHPDFFSNTYINLVAASEEAGYMHEVLQQLIDMEEKRENLNRIIMSALTYPAFLLVFAVAVIIFVLVVVFPKFTDLFSLIADQLPASTVFLMAASDMIQKYWEVQIITLVIMISGFKIWVSTDQGRTKIDWLKLKLPMVKNIFIQLYLVQFLRILSLSLKNGVNIMDALRTSRQVVNNRIFQQFVIHVEEQVEQGNGIAIGFQSSSFIPPIVAQMIKTGEDTGQLPKVLGRLSNYYETELSNRLQTLSRMAEPIMLLIMGGVVGIIVSSLILPIFKLSRAVG